MVEGIHWKAISRFESHDFVAKWYRNVHGRSASSAKVGQINACFAHGREYFRNAAGSEMSVKPLLVYYGVLSCCRRVILANDPEKKEESLKPRHGRDGAAAAALQGLGCEHRSVAGISGTPSADRRANERGIISQSRSLREEINATIRESLVAEGAISGPARPGEKLAARVLPTVIDREPDAVTRALAPPAD